MSHIPAKSLGWRFVGLAVVVAVLVGCWAGSASIAVPSATPSTAQAATATPATTSTAAPTDSAPSIVGEWVGVHDCERLLAMMHDAGLDEFAAEQVYGNELVPGVTTPEDLQDPTQPCLGAVRRQHSHYFTVDGAFGSRDFNGQQVDDGRYELQGEDIVVINGSTFHYQIDGDTISFQPDPVDTSGCSTKECKFEAVWVLMVAMPGATWTRGTISG